MSKISTQRGQRGIAFLVAMFALLLLSVIGLGMMYSTNMETAINSNYRDKQASLYASLAGLQEARDRIQPATHNIVAPDDLPTTSAAKVIYIVADAATVRPWDPSNSYFDTELCQEKVMGLSGTPGLACPTSQIPAGTAWYTVNDDSQSSSAPWNLANPLDWKWTRITLKGNNVTPVAVDGNTANSTQVCWDEKNQTALPAGYGSTCGPDGSIATVTLLTQGTGYNIPNPNVIISNPPAGGVQAAATVTTQLVSGIVVSVDATTGGSGYHIGDVLSFSGGGGAGAAANVTNVASGGAPVASLASFNAGAQCYSSPPAVSFVGGGGSGATATATLESSNSCVYSWTISGSCSTGQHNGTVLTNVHLTGGNDSFRGGWTASSTGGGKTIVANTMTIQDPGTGYTTAPTMPVSSVPYPSCTGPTVSVSLGKRLQSVNLTSGGSGYTSTPAVNIGTGTGSAVAPPSATAVLGTPSGVAGRISAITVTNSGSGYTSSPTVSFAATSGSGAVLTASTAQNYTVTGINLVAGQHGKGYISDPTVTIVPAGGSGATAKATIGHGPNLGSVWLLTSYAQTKSGARTMTQAEVASPVLGFATTAALTIAGPSPSMGAMPNSSNYGISGIDANSCGTGGQPPHPAVGAYDNPNAPTGSVQTIIDSIPAGRQGNYVGSSGTTPDVQNVYGSLGETMGTPTGLKALIDAVAAAPGAHTFGPGSYTDSNIKAQVDYRVQSNPKVIYVDGDLNIGGNETGYGILVVTGKLTMQGNFTWKGLVFVVGEGWAELGGGGGGQIVGSVFISKIWDNYTDHTLLPTLGSPHIQWNGGGTNYIQYDHCWADDMMNNVPFTPPPSTKPLKTLSFRILPY